MNLKRLILSKYSEFSGKEPSTMIELPLSGSDRRYFRIDGVIGVYNPVQEENDAFVGFSDHFRSVGLKVPEVYKYFRADNVYFIQDLGETNLFSWLAFKRRGDEFEDKVIAMYRNVLDNLVLFQCRGINKLDLKLCYPHKSFDRQSIMWDMNYFKYMFLKLIAVPFNESKLEKDFITLTDFLIEAGDKYFLYRDFQSANIMILRNEPWFIDYQGGRKGAPQYDVASLLYDSKALLSQQIRYRLLEYYIGKFTLESGEEAGWFTNYYPAFCLIRIMQAMGAYGLRGLVEHKPGFAESLLPALADINQVITRSSQKIDLSELYKVIESLDDSDSIKRLKEDVK